jgi:hypothetical protein
MRAALQSQRDGDAGRLVNDLAHTKSLFLVELVANDIHTRRRRFPSMK